MALYVYRDSSTYNSLLVAVIMKLSEFFFLEGMVEFITIASYKHHQAY